MSTEVLYNVPPRDQFPPARGPPLPRTTHLSQLRARLGREVRASSRPGRAPDHAHALGTHALLEAVHLAHRHRLPLTLAPADVWLCVLQGAGLHLRATHKQVVSSRLTNPAAWAECVGVEGAGQEWASAAAMVGEVVQGAVSRVREPFKDNLFPPFAMATEVQRVCVQTSLGNPLCTPRKSLLSAGSEGGVAEVCLEGDAEVWAGVHDNTVQLLKDLHYDLDWWVDSLLPLLDHCAAATAGRPDNAFWSRIYKSEYPNRGEDPFIHGWINVLFPYLETRGGEYVVNDWPYRLAERRLWEAPLSTHFPSGLTSVPFSRTPHHHPASGDRKYSLVSGFVGVTRDRRTQGVRPLQGWAVVEDVVHKPRPLSPAPHQAPPPAKLSASVTEESDV